LAAGSWGVGKSYGIEWKPGYGLIYAICNITFHMRTFRFGGLRKYTLLADKGIDTRSFNAWIEER